MTANSNNNAGTSRPRPVDLPLRKIRLPIGGVVSIMHRVTGVLLVLLVPVALHLLERSLRGPEEFEQVSALFRSGTVRIVMALVAVILLQHLFSGLRHLLLDIDVGTTRKVARRSAWASFLATIAVFALLYGLLA